MIHKITRYILVDGTGKYFFAGRGSRHTMFKFTKENVDKHLNRFYISKARAESGIRGWGSYSGSYRFVIDNMKSLPKLKKIILGKKDKEIYNRDWYKLDELKADKYSTVEEYVNACPCKNSLYNIIYGNTMKVRKIEITYDIPSILITPEI